MPPPYSITLEFLPPDEPDLATLHVYEAPAAGGPFTLIDQTSQIGTYPNYITRFTTNQASVQNDWYAIAWVNTTGNEGALSEPLQGGTTTLVSEVANRVLLRDPNLNHLIVGQETEAAISAYYGVTDPYTIDPATVPPNVMSGLTYFTMARSYVSVVASTTTVGTANKWTAGIVSMDTGSTASSKTSPWDNIEKLLEIANRELGVSYSVIMLMKEIPVAGRYTHLAGVDISRSEIDIIAVP